MSQNQPGRKFTKLTNFYMSRSPIGHTLVSVRRTTWRQVRDVVYTCRAVCILRGCVMLIRLALWPWMNYKHSNSRHSNEQECQLLQTTHTSAVLPVEDLTIKMWTVYVISLQRQTNLTGRVGSLATLRQLVIRSVCNNTHCLSVDH